MDFKKLIQYFQNQIEELVQYCNKYNIVISISYLIDMKDKLNKLKINNDTLRELQHGYEYLKVINKGKEEDIVKNEEKFRTLISMFDEIESYNEKHKRKPRHDLNKPQNQMGSRCSYYESVNGSPCCENSFVADVSICKGNPHNCVKVKYKRLASRNDKQKNNN